VRLRERVLAGETRVAQQDRSGLRDHECPSQRPVPDDDGLGPDRRVAAGLCAAVSGVPFAKRPDTGKRRDHATRHGKPIVMRDMSGI